jgi:hypothetical protein
VASDREPMHEQDIHANRGDTMTGGLLSFVVTAPLV